MPLNSFFFFYIWSTTVKLQKKTANRQEKQGEQLIMYPLILQLFYRYISVSPAVNSVILQIFFISHVFKDVLFLSFRKRFQYALSVCRTGHRKAQGALWFKMDRAVEIFVHVLQTKWISLLLGIYQQAWHSLSLECCLRNKFIKASAALCISVWHFRITAQVFQVKRVYSFTPRQLTRRTTGAIRGQRMRERP